MSTTQPDKTDQRAPATSEGSSPSFASEPVPMTHPEIVRSLIALLSAFFVAMLSGTVVATALPRIMGDLQGDQTAYTWTITATLLANAATTPIFGKLADMFDKKLLVQMAIVVFVLGSMLAGFAHSVAFLITARVVQGIAMGALMALAMAIMAAMIPPRERGRYSGYMAVTMGLATAGGPLLGGFLVDSAWGWRSTFFVPVPIAILSLILIQRTLHLPHLPRRQKIDWWGAFFLAAGVTSILIWISFAGKEGYYEWISWQSALMLGGGLAALVICYFIERNVSAPIIPLKIIAERTTALSILASVFVGVGMFASSAFLGQYFQVARGETPTVSGLLMLPMIAGNMIGSVVSGRLITAKGRWKRFLVLGTVLAALGFGLLGMIDHATSLVIIGADMLLVGLGLGMLMQNLVLAVQNNVGSKDIGAASASVAFFRSFGGAIGVSVLGAILASRVHDSITERLTQFATEQAKAGRPLDPQALKGMGSGSLDIGALPPPVQEIVRGAYGDAMAYLFLVISALTLISFVAVLFIRERSLRRTIDLEPEKPQANPAKPLPRRAAP